MLYLHSLKGEVTEFEVNLKIHSSKPMGTFNFQIHFKIGDSSLSEITPSIADRSQCLN